MPKKRSGLPTIIDNRLLRKVRRQVLANREVTRAELADTNGVSIWTITKCRKKLGFKKCVARKKPFLNKENIKIRNMWAKKFKDESNFWKKVIFSDESAFEVVRKRKKHVWRKKNEVFKKDCLSGSVQGYGGSVMVWGAIWWNGRSDLLIVDSKIDSWIYMIILEKGILHEIRKSFENYLE